MCTCTPADTQHKNKQTHIKPSCIHAQIKKKVKHTLTSVYECADSEVLTGSGGLL